MIIDAVVDRVENGNAYFVLSDIGAEISIPENEGYVDEFSIGDVVELIIANDGKVTVNEK